MKLSAHLRWLLATLVLATALGLLASLVYATDAALSIIERLQRLPIWLATLVGLLMSAVVTVAGYLLWRLLRRSRIEAPIDAQDRRALAQRMARVGPAAAPIEAELAASDARAQTGELYVAVFGDVSAGKSALVRALLPVADAQSDVRAGTTLSVRTYRGDIAPGYVVHISDVPGANEWAGEARAVSAREEALRAHLVLFVVDGDLTRSQLEEIEWLRLFGKPIWLVLNKADRYAPAERATLLAQLRKRHDPVVVVSAGGFERIEREIDGHRISEERSRAPEVGELRRLLQRAIGAGAGQWEAARQQAVEKAAHLKLSDIEARQRAETAQQLVRGYAQKAAVGALAAVAPGTDLVIQGVLATRLLQALCDLYGVKLRQLDLDRFVALAGGRLRGTSALILAIAGNALKAFPGLGTIGGGLVHAVAYALIFDSLGRAVAETLARGEGFDADRALDRLDSSLRQEGLLERVPEMLKLTLDARDQRENP